MPRRFQWDLPLLITYFFLVGIGLVALYSVGHAEAAHVDPLIWQKQLMWWVISLVLAVGMWRVRRAYWGAWAYVFYVLGLALLAVTLVAGGKVAGTRAWLQFGGVNLQPAELMKVFVGLALAHYLTTPGFDLRWNGLFLWGAVLIVLVPMGLIFLQNDTGTALMFAGYVLVFIRKGISPWVLLPPLLLAAVFLSTIYFSAEAVAWVFTAIAVVAGWLGWRFAGLRGVMLVVLVWGVGLLIAWGSESAFQMLKPHQQQRILVTIGKISDPRGQGYNLQQSLIAIGSGGFSGKGFGQGSQTQYGFVPEQHTDFVFTVIAEEWGWLGAMAVLVLYAVLLLRVLALAERSSSEMVCLFGYAFVGITAMHALINLASVMGLFPVVGVPLPYISYGGSALVAFSLFLFMFMDMAADARRAVL